jgi:S1/P1 nuclease
MVKRLVSFAGIVLVVGWAAPPVHAWDSVGHMIIAYAAYQDLTPTTKARASALVRMNPKYKTWLTWLPTGTPKRDRDAMLFMIAATWADQIKSEPGYTTDGDHGGNRPEGSPDPSGNHGYGDRLRHKYWHFIDTPFTRDGTALPPIPEPNAGERIALFRGVLSSNAPAPLKSYDLVWLLHLVGDVHQPLHSVTHVSVSFPEGDDGGNAVKLRCHDCPPDLHAYWDDLPGTAPSIQAAIAPAITAARALPKVDPTMAGKLDGPVWIAESMQAAQEAAYQPPIADGAGPFTPTSTYDSAAARVAQERIALAGARLARLLNRELK